MFKVLIAEDEPLIRKGIIYCTDWARLNCGIPLEASNGEEAAEMIRQHRPDIVLLDVNMPLMDGLDAQTRGLYFFVPIVVTGYSDFDYAKRAMYSGVQRYLLKPVVASELEEAIRFAQQKLEHHRLMAHELARQTDTTQTLGDLPVQQGKSQPVRQVMAYVEEHYPEKITIGIMAQKFHYSELQKRDGHQLFGVSHPFPPAEGHGHDAGDGQEHQPDRRGLRFFGVPLFPGRVPEEDRLFAHAVCTGCAAYAKRREWCVE